MEPRRVENLTAGEFLEYVRRQEPIVITDAMRDWGLRAWTTYDVRAQFGSSTVQVYDDLFELVDVCPLSDYLDQYFHKHHPASSVPYVRWYTKFKDVDFIWADEDLDRVKDQWTHPYFMPNSSFVFPFCMPPRTISPMDALFPAKGLFISGRGARTKLHRDPWASDAVLFQICGEKKWTMYAPEQGRLLSGDDGTCVDIDAPNTSKYPGFERARADFEFVLCPGEAVFVPQGWFHHVTSESDCISLTWNFVHRTTVDRFLSYLDSNPTGHDLQVLQFFFSSWLKQKNATAAQIAEFIKVHCGSVAAAERVG